MLRAARANGITRTRMLLNQLNLYTTLHYYSETLCDQMDEFLMIARGSGFANHPFYVHLCQTYNYVEEFSHRCRDACRTIHQQLENMAQWWVLWNVVTGLPLPQHETIQYFALLDGSQWYLCLDHLPKMDGKAASIFGPFGWIKTAKATNPQVKKIDFGSEAIISMMSWCALVIFQHMLIWHTFDCFTDVLFWNHCRKLVVWKTVCSKPLQTFVHQIQINTPDHTYWFHSAFFIWPFIPLPFFRPPK